MLLISTSKILHGCAAEWISARIGSEREARERIAEKRALAADGAKQELVGWAKLIPKPDGRLNRQNVYYGA